MTYTVLAVFNILFAVMIAITTLVQEKGFWEEKTTVVWVFAWLLLHVLNAIALLMR